MFILIVIIFSFMLYGLGSLPLQKGSLLYKLALGLAAIPILGVILHVLHIPIDWRIFLGTALLGIVLPLRRLKGGEGSVHPSYSGRTAANGKRSSSWP
ncbi:MAG: hypothetical protein ACLFPX_02470 [Candidatus Omnitrophota bacterium]